MASSRLEWIRKPSISSVAPAAVPIPIVSTRMPRSRAALIAASGVGFTVFSPSLNRTMTAGSWTPLGTGVGSGVGGGEPFV